MVRVKRRYIVLKIGYQQAKQPQDAFLKELKDKISALYGDFGVACFNRGYAIKRYDPKDGFMILCVRKGVHEIVMSAIPLITNVDRAPCSINIIHLSGTMRSSLKELKRVFIMDVRASMIPAFEVIE